MFAMKRMIAATVGLAFLTALSGVAFAQPSNDDDPIMQDVKRKQKEREEIDKRYKSTLEQTRGGAPAAQIDPWSNMRGADTPKAKK
jgi:hypothetical protein